MNIDSEVAHFVKSVDSLLSNEEIVDSSISLYILMPFSDSYYSRFEDNGATGRLVIRRIGKDNLDNETLQIIDLDMNALAKFKHVIQQYEPYEQGSIQDAIVDDGYTVVVRTNYVKSNEFLMRVFTNKGKKSNQYRFVSEYLKLVNKHGYNIEL